MNSEPAWYKYYENTPKHLKYNDLSMYGFLKQGAKAHPGLYAYEFEGKKTNYKEFLAQISQCAQALKAVGIKENDKVTICLPNVPQAIIMFYAINSIGAVANMVHPLSAENEIAFFLELSESKAAITLDRFYYKFAAISERIKLDTLIIATIQEVLDPLKRFAYNMFVVKQKPDMKNGPAYISWKDFMKKGRDYEGECFVEKHSSDVAAILYSGGTTGRMKGILLTNGNFNALAMQTVASGDCIAEGDTMLSIMPVFHGFGLGICIHTALTHGMKCILVPQFDLKTYGNILKKKHPNVIAGVPTLYEALLRLKTMDGVDLSFLKGVFSGGDSLSVELKKKVDKFLSAHNAKVQIREGYGTTECVTASCLTPKNYAREGSIGIPFPDTYYAIVEPGTTNELPVGQEGEIVLKGPSVMLGYLNDEVDNKLSLVKHPDGDIWLHTGDLGKMDEDGFVYFKLRLKRMIVTSGYNVYPTQLENVIDAHEDVLISCVIGVPDPYKMQKVKAYVVLKDGVEPTDAVKESIKAHCVKNIAKYAMPYEFEFRKELPKTLVGKVAYTQLEKENAADNK